MELEKSSWSSEKKKKIKKNSLRCNIPICVKAADWYKTGQLVLSCQRQPLYSLYFYHHQHRQNIINFVKDKH